MCYVSFVAYMLRANLSVAVVAMVRTKVDPVNDTALLNVSALSLGGEGMGDDVKTDDMVSRGTKVVPLK